MNTVNAAAIFSFKGALLSIKSAVIIHRADISWKKGWGRGNMIFFVCLAGIGSNKALCTAAFHCLLYKLFLQPLFPQGLLQNSSVILSEISQRAALGRMLCRKTGGGRWISVQDCACFAGTGAGGESSAGWTATWKKPFPQCFTVCHFQTLVAVGCCSTREGVIKWRVLASCKSQYLSEQARLSVGHDRLLRVLQPCMIAFYKLTFFISLQRDVSTALRSAHASCFKILLQFAWNIYI